MRSRTAARLVRDRSERMLAMTPDERVAIALRLGEEGLAAYIAVHAVDRHAAITRIKATRRLGRRRSAAADCE